MQKKKCMTNKEKQARAAIKKRLQKEGTLPPDKPKLNRKKFVEEAMEEWNARDSGCHIWEYYLVKAMSFMAGHVERRTMRTSLEAVGAAKAIKIALRLREFSEKLKAEGRKQYTIGEQYEYIKDIMDA